jgi:hypothetical protein
VKQSENFSAGIQGLSALGLCGIGVLSFIVGIVVFFGWLIKDRRSDPDATPDQILISMGVGAVILASSVACFVFAGRLVKWIARAELPNE